MAWCLDRRLCRGVALDTILQIEVRTFVGGCRMMFSVKKIGFRTSVEVPDREKLGTRKKGQAGSPHSTASTISLLPIAEGICRKPALEHQYLASILCRIT